MILEFFHKNKRVSSSYLLNDIAINIKKPKLGINIVIEDSIKLKKLLLEDPKKRFILQGELNKTKVYLSKQGLSIVKVYNYYIILVILNNLSCLFNIIISFSK